MKKFLLFCIVMLASASTGLLGKGKSDKDLVLIQMIDSTTFRNVQLSDFVGRDGKLTLIDFWSVACGYCPMALPALNEIGTEYADKLHVVSIHTAGEMTQQEACQTEWLRYTRKAESKGYSLYTNLFDPQGMQGVYKNRRLKGWPSYMLLDAEGNVLAKWFGGYQKEHILKKIAKYLK